MIAFAECMRNASNAFTLFVASVVMSSCVGEAPSREASEADGSPPVADTVDARTVEEPIGTAQQEDAVGAIFGGVGGALAGGIFGGLVFGPVGGLVGGLAGGATGGWFGGQASADRKPWSPPQPPPADPNRRKVRF